MDRHAVVACLRMTDGEGVPPRGADIATRTFDPTTPEGRFAGVERKVLIFETCAIERVHHCARDRVNDSRGCLPKDLEPARMQLTKASHND
jgi:hypothetical protein